ncbi:hypothetical protein ABK040_002420 [Willaertia magna]
MLASKRIVSLSLMDCQKESILNMLNTDSEIPSSLNKSTKKKKSSTTSSPPTIEHVITGHELGHQLIERKVQKWKILIMDKFCFEIVSPLFKVGDLRAMGITLVLSIEEKRQSIPDAPAIYFVQPTLKNIDLISEDCSKELYQSIYINFCHSNYKRELLESLALKLVQNEATHFLTNIYDQFLNFSCLENNFFSLLSLENCLEQLHEKKKEDEEINKVMERISNGICSVMLCYGSKNFASSSSLSSSSSFAMPVIVCPSSKSQPARLVAENVEKQLRNLMNSPLKEVNNSSSSYDSMKNQKKNRPLLIIMDRSIDLTVCLQHQWTYRAMVHDLFQLRSNQVKVPVKEKKKDNNESSTSTTTNEHLYEISNEDEFWNENAMKPFQDVAQNVAANTEKHRSKFTEFKKRTGLNMSEDDLSNQETLNSSSSNNETMSKNMIDEVFKMAEERKRVNMHTNIAYAILHQVNERKLDEFVAIEEALVNKQSNKIEVSLLHSLLNVNEGKGNLKDKVRLLLICYLYILQQEALQQTPSIITRPELQKYAYQMYRTRLQNVENSEEEEDNLIDENSSLESILPEISFLREITMNTQYNIIRSMSNQSKQQQSSFVHFTKKISILGEQIKSIASGLNEYYGEDGLEYATTLTRIVDAIVNNNSKKLSDHEEFLFIDPKLPVNHSTLRTFSKSTNTGSSTSSNNNTGRMSPVTDLNSNSPGTNNLNNLDTYTDVIVFVVGGGNYMEYHNLTQYFNKNKNNNIQITYGATDIVTGEQFLEQMQRLGK